MAATRHASTFPSQGTHGSKPGAEDATRSTEPVIHAAFYSLSQPVRTLAADEVAAVELSDQSLLWVDLCAPDAEQIRWVTDAVGLPPGLADFALHSGDAPELRNLGSPFGVRAQVAGFSAPLRFDTTPLIILCGTNVVVTIAPHPLRNITELRERQQQNSELGSLSAQSFTSSVLDGLLATYYDALSHIEAEVEKLEITLLSSRQADCLALLRSLRKATSRLRRVLADHRRLFGGLARPEFRPQQDPAVDAHFAALESRYERAMDLAEHGRELVVGTFELFTTRAAMSTNETMKVLTFATVLIGALAVVAGILGMNFSAWFFDSGDVGFWTAVGAMALLAILAIWWGKRRDWL